MTNFEVGQWVWSYTHEQGGKVIEASSLWGSGACRVWLPQSGAVVKLPINQLSCLGGDSRVTPDYVAYVAAAARIAASQNDDILLAPISSNVIPLPHQLKCLNRAMSKPQVRYLLADEVGLGKTIEAGLIMRELKLRGLARRILVVAPKGLATQWISEMDVHFNETFHLILPGEHRSSSDNIWASHDQVICSMDSIKPIEKRRGWNIQKVEDYNRRRFDDLIAAGWDLIVVDESHRLQGSTESVARYKLGQGLSDAAPYFLLLSATPHQGKSDGFHRLMALLDREAFPDESSITEERVKPYVIRTEKRQAIDADGNPLFRPRRTELKSIAWKPRHGPQRDLYEAVTEYVRDGYNQALASKQNAVGFLMILMQRLVVSSPSAIKGTLERRLQVLIKPSLAQQDSLLTEEDWEDLDGQQQVETMLNNREFVRTAKALKSEQQEVEWLLNLADQCVNSDIDAKADALLGLVTELQREENDPNLKVLIFTEFVATQMMLAEFLRARGMLVATLNGSLSMSERKDVQNEFSGPARILISTDAGGEGLNLQFCHVIINYDIPWNPMRLEQRIGRVDRIGQKRVVRAINLVLADTVEHRVREVLEEKLAIILEQFGVDKTGDVLDSAQAGQLFDELYTGAIQNPGAIDDEVARALEELKSKASASQSSKALFVDDTPIDPEQANELRRHPLPHWLERMTLSYLRHSTHGQAEKVDNGRQELWDLIWPDGEEWRSCRFLGSNTNEPRGGKSHLAERAAEEVQISLEQPKIRGLIYNPPRWIPAEPIPVCSIAGLPDTVDGTWSLWQIKLEPVDPDISNPRASCTAFFPLFISCEGKSFPATAKRIWETLLSHVPVFGEPDLSERPESVFDALKEQAIIAGEGAFLALKQEYECALDEEAEKTNYGFTARRKAVARIGLPEVRNYRLGLLDTEVSDWRSNLNHRKQTAPELNPLLVLRVVPEAVGL
ncbi:helicase-related protein [Marinobacter sp. S6332]|uniref:DEAD/DEAH box helicase n=1 Tax=Marinobacter sp. S6332 TaxID=2926403 RepID=UPI001FF65213|nr:SNF2-related protein [Marinobacter sp. S6332]